MRVGFRALSDKVAETIADELKRICEGIASAHNVKVEIKTSNTTPYPTTVNHPKETEIAIEAMRAIAGAETASLTISSR